MTAKQAMEGLASWIVLVFLATPQTQRDKPNVVVLSGDDVGWASLNIDRVAPRLQAGDRSRMRGRPPLSGPSGGPEHRQRYFKPCSARVLQSRGGSGP
jgi:hypothetical protein